MKEIRTERLLLRPFRESDYDDLFEFLLQLKDDEFEGYPGITYENGREYLRQRLGSEEFYAVELPDSGKVIGNIYCGNRDFDAKEVGYIINRDYRRTGYAAEALSAVIKNAFREGAHRVFAECDPRRSMIMEEMKMDRPVTTLYMLMSVDGKISTGSTDELDVDRDFPKITGLKEGLHQYYEIEQTTDLWSFNTGRVQAKMGVNEKEMPEKTPVSFVLLDNRHLNEHGVRYFCARSRQFVLITSNRDHPAFGVDEDNLHILFQERLSLAGALETLKKQFGCERLTVQSGGTVNGLFLREKLFDYVDLVVAPVLIGGKDTATLIDGRSLTSAKELAGLGVLKLTEATPLQDSYIRLRYRVIG